MAHSVVWKCCAAAALGGLAGCATPVRDQLLWVHVRGAEQCEVRIAKSRFTLPRDQPRLRSRLKREAKRSSAALIDFGPAEPEVRCWGSVMALAREAEFPRLGFLDPEPEGEETPPE